MPATKRKVFVTVGTTKFEKLVETITSDTILNKLHQLGYSELMIQTGNSHFDEKKSHSSITIKHNKFFQDFLDEITKYDLIISHAGAGTCLEVLHSGKPLIIVVNEDLMDNHQLELAQQLEHDNYVYWATCETLKNVLGKDLSNLKKYPKPSKHLFNNYLNKCMGLV